MLGKLRKLIFGISLEETTVARRGFTVSDEGMRQYLEKIGQIFVQGYHAALLDDNPATLAPYLYAEVEAEYQGFAFEGAGMGLALLDMLTPWRKSRLQQFLDGPGGGHYYMVHIGLGWALARLRRPVENRLKRLDPLVGWLAVEGFGFHEGFFHWPRTIQKQERPAHLTGYACRVFDQGLGRSLWFVKGADVAGISATISAFSSERQSDLWSGVGLACGYAGGVDASAIRALVDAAAPHQAPFAQGAAFAAATRQRAKNPVAHTELACQILWGKSLDEIAHLVNLAAESLPFDGPEPAWEVWRQRTQAQWSAVRPGHDVVHALASDQEIVR